MSAAAAGTLPGAASSWVGILGGTFDPVHSAHLELAEAARVRLALDCVLLMPAPNPRLRSQPVADVAARVQMIERAVSGREGLALDAREVARPGPTSTVETLEEMRREVPDRGLCLILGGDAFARLDRWCRWEDLFALCHIAVASRPGARARWSAALSAAVAPRRAEPGRSPRDADVATGLVFECAMPVSDLSASEIRACVARGEPITGMVPDAVAAFIAERGLYARDE